MKKLNVYASANSENHIRKHGSCIVTDHQPDEAQLRPSLLLIAEEGEELPEVMTKEEVRSMLLDVALAADRHYERQRADDPFEFRRKLWAAVSKHGITL